MLLLSMLSTITGGFCFMVSSSNRVRRSLSVFMLERTQPSEHRTSNCHLPYLRPFFAIIRQILQQHTTPKHVADDKWMYSDLNVVFALTSIQTPIQMTRFHLPSISVNSTLQAVMSRITVVQVWVGRTDGHQIRSVHRTPPSASEEATNSLCHYAND